MPMSGTQHDPMSVIVMTAEDGLADTVTPRLKVAGANLESMHAIIARKNTDGYESPLSFPEDVDALRDEIRRTGAGLVIIDPLNAFLTGRADSHRDHHVRRALHPLTILAEEEGVAILIVSHLNKSPGGTSMYRVGGSIGVIAAARSALLVATDPEDDGQRVLAVLKSNLAAKPQALTFRLEEDPEYGVAKIKWAGFSDLTCAELLAPPRKEREHRATDVASDFLGYVLADGPLPVENIMHEAAVLGISETTLQRAKRAKGIMSTREGFGEDGIWTWALKKDEQG